MSGGAFALFAGIVYTLLGIAGLFPAARSGGMLFALFPMSVTLAVLHMVIGIAGLAAAAHERHVRRYARGAAVFLGLLGVLGLTGALRAPLAQLPLYGSNVWLHLGTAMLAAYFGWRAEIPVLREEHMDPERRRGPQDRRDTVTTVSRERRHGAYDRRMPLGA